MAYIQPTDIEIREKLKVECPELIKQAGLTQLDFGKLFLNSEGEAIVGSIEQNTNGIIDITKNIDNIVSQEMVDAIKDTLTYIGEDILKQSTDYINSVFKTYISPEYATQLAMTISRSTLYYTKQFTKTPAELYKEVEADYANTTESKSEEEQKKQQKDLISNINKIFNKTIEIIKKILKEISPYVEELRRLAIYGPDYLTQEIVALYKKHLSMAISTVDEAIASVITLIEVKTDYWALTIGQKTAEKINEQQKRLLKKQFEKAKKLEAQTKVKAKSAINKATLKLLSLLGG